MNRLRRLLIVRAELVFGQLKDEHEFRSEPIPPPTAANDNSEILEADKK
jgi:hypothetical protein